MDAQNVTVRTSNAINMIVDNGTVKKDAVYEDGVFQCWEHYKNEDYSKVYAVVVLESGKVGRYEIENVAFIR